LIKQGNFEIALLAVSKFVLPWSIESWIQFPTKNKNKNNN
jgi:hypothetical protein